MPHFFLGVGLIVFFFVFQHFFKNFSPPLTPSHVLCGFSEHWADSDLHCNCCAPLPHMVNLPKHQEADKKNATLKVRNKVFECTTLLKIEVIEYGKMDF